jgi:predicted glutamine amidotransferase
MCGISGAKTFDKAWDLYQLNLKRGSFSSGFLAFDNQHNVYVKKQKEPFDKETLRWNITMNIGTPEYCLFHSRAPTNSNRPFEEATTHPFEFGNYYVAHNGIITNFKSFPESAEFIVDSSIIPFHLTKHKDNFKEVFESYEGLLTCWVYDYVNMSLRVVKAGSSLHIGSDCFSSVEFENSIPAEDGSVHFLYRDKLVEAKGLAFKYDNPYDL